jgi:hypothetical protein
MTMSAAAAGAAAAAAIANAIKASGTIVNLAPEDFARLVRRLQAPLVVHTISGVFSTRHEYLTSYKGLAFHTKSRDSISLPGDAEVIEARRMWMPS